VAPKQSRAMNPEALKELVEHANVRTAAGLEEAIAGASGTTFVSGSLFLVGEARRLYRN
jgi:folylpolyglutamate synthase/dihydropteroate synthase